MKSRGTENRSAVQLTPGIPQFARISPLRISVAGSRLLAGALLIGLPTLWGCNPQPLPGPDKQVTSAFRGAATGAGAGAVIGAQVAAAAGPGAAVGAGLGAVAGGIEGFLDDQQEEVALQIQHDTAVERQRALAHEIIRDHFKKRLELHPTRDIFPADIFFYGDESKLKPSATMLVRELGRLNKERLPWSRLVVVAYAMAQDGKSEYAQGLADRRAREICDHMTHYGIEPRRLAARGVVLPEPILIDPSDRPERYAQAVELIAVDR